MQQRQVHCAAIHGSDKKPHTPHMSVQLSLPRPGGPLMGCACRAPVVVAPLAAQGLLFRTSVMVQGIVAHVATEAMLSAPQARSPAQAACRCLPRYLVTAGRSRMLLSSCRCAVSPDFMARLCA